MAPLTNLVASILLIASPVAAGVCGLTDYTKNGMKWTRGELRMNQVQVVGTHNSYHAEASAKEKSIQEGLLGDLAEDLWYGHELFGCQLAQQHVRNLEIDVLADPNGGNYAKPLIAKLAGLPYPTNPAYNESSTKVMHIPDLDIHSVCDTLTDCLLAIKAWMDAHPDAVPLPIMMEFKTAETFGQDSGGAKVIPWDGDGLLDGLDEEIRAVFKDEQLLTPDDVRREDMGLEASILRYGWPNLESVRGKIFFLMDNGPVSEIRDKYRKGAPNLEGRVLFTNAAPGDTDCAFQKLNDPSSPENVANIQAQVKAGYYVRTRADIPLETVRQCSTSMRDMALKSGAQVVSTDFPASGLSERYGGCKYSVTLPGGKSARCNPVNGGGCKGDLEPGGYLQ